MTCRSMFSVYHNRKLSHLWQIITHLAPNVKIDEVVERDVYKIGINISQKRLFCWFKNSVISVNILRMNHVLIMLKYMYKFILLGKVFASCVWKLKNAGAFLNIGKRSCLIGLKSSIRRIVSKYPKRGQYYTLHIGDDTVTLYWEKFLPDRSKKLNPQDCF